MIADADAFLGYGGFSGIYGGHFGKRDADPDAKADADADADAKAFFVNGGRNGISGKVGQPL